MANTWKVEKGKATYQSGGGNIVLNGVSSGVKSSGDNLVAEGGSGGVPEGAIHITADNISQYFNIDFFDNCTYNLTSGNYYIDSAINLGEYSVRVNEDATLYVLDGANITSDDTALSNSGTVNITGGSFSTNDGIALSNFGTVNITGGSFSTNDGIALANSGEAVANISGGSFSGITALNNIGTANISGGTFTSTSVFCHALENAGTANIVGGTFSGDTALFNWRGTANISGGEFTAKYNALYNEEKYTANVYSTTNDNTGTYAKFNGIVNNKGTINYATTFDDMNVEQFNAYISSQMPTSESKTVAGISGKVLNVYDNAIFGSKGAITVSGNEGEYTFNIGEKYTGKFYGTSGADTISVKGAAYINGLNGNDVIYNNSKNKKVTIAGGKGDDFISAGKGDLILYNSGDGNDVIESFNSNSSLSIAGGTYTTVVGGDDVIVTVGDGKVTLVNAKEYDLNIIGTYGGDTTPADTTPADTTPADTTPADTTPADTTPADTTPADTTPADTTPADTTPADTTPADTTPADTTPADTTPADTTPADTTPADTTPADTTPADTTPADTTPADTTPADTTPADTTPADTIPADTVPPNVFVIEGDTKTSIDMSNSGYDSIVASSGKVILENYNSDSEAGIVTPNVSDIAKGIKDKSIVLSGDEIEVNSSATVKVSGSEDFTTANLISSEGKTQKVAFTGKNGGDLDIRGKSGKFILQGNYVGKNSKGTNIIGNSNNDIIFAGSKDTINGGGGQNTLYLTNPKLRKNEDGATIVLGDKSQNTVSGFGSNDVVQVEDLDDFTYSFKNKNLVLSSDKGKLKFDDVMTEGITISDGSDEIKAVFADSGESISVDGDNLPTKFLGKKSGLDFSAVDEKTYVNLSEGIGTVNRKSFGMSGINKVQAGDGNSTVIGSDSGDTLTAGDGSTNLSGGKGADLLIGRSDSDNKTGRTTFQFEAGDGHDVIKNFEFMTGDNSKTADSISVDGDVNSAHLSGDDVIVVLDGGAQIKVKDAADKVISINGLAAKVGRKLSYDGVADNYIGSGTSSLSVDSSVGSAEIWLDNSQDTKFYGDIRTLDASEVKGSTKLVGNDSDNVIYAGQGDASLWGGASASNDELIGGGGKNTFFYCNGNGNDVIKSNGVNDTVILADVMAENLASGNITANSVTINLTDGGSLTVNGTTDVTYQLADGSQYSANRSTGEWQAK